MIRLALGAKCSGWMTPVHRSTFTPSAARSSAGSSSDAKASEPRPVADRPRKARRLICWRMGSIALIPRNRFVQVENHTGDGGPGGELGGVNVGGDGPFADVDQVR